MDELEKLAAAERRDKARWEKSRDALRQAIREHAAAGIPQVEIVRATGYTRETIRQIVAR